VSMILTLNAGSSSLKFALFDVRDDLCLSLRGEVESVTSAPHLTARDATGAVLADRVWPAHVQLSAADVLDAVLSMAEQRSVGAIAGIGHRVVHGGSAHVTPELVTPALMADLKALTPLDPLHMPASLEAIRAMEMARPHLTQIACFDTAFHQAIPREAAEFALPRDVTKAGVRRYGFHGLSYEYVAGKVAATAPALFAGRVVVAHLGAGASLCALKGGVSIATTTGFCTLDGLVMATRCGVLDPGVVFYLARQGQSLDAIEDMLYRRSGLLGASGVSGDVRVLLASDDPHAREALDLFTYRVAVDIGAMTIALGGIDGLVFTAGIGAHASEIRRAICDRLSCLGVTLDAARNAAGAPFISADGSAVKVCIIATNEEAMIARHTAALLCRVNERNAQ